MEKFVEEILQYNANYDAALIEKAYLKAKQLHEGQFRKSGEPYIIHPLAVAKILAELGVDDVAIAAGLLHDVVEDTEYSLDALRADFGDEIALIVDGVTKLTSFVYDSKEARQNETIRKLFLAMAKDIRVLIIKLADRLHNMRTINFMKPEKQKEKSRETLEIYAPLAARLGIYAFKFELEDISFRVLEPEAYAEIDQQMYERTKQRKNSIESIIETIKENLASTNIKYDIYGRYKHYYSIYKKMNIQHKQLDEIFDLTAVRVIVDSVRDCYAVLGAVHTIWTPIPGRFKDYIAMPKPNMYQSLHTTVIDSNGLPFEIQIRTWDMHRVAEYGIAAHWKYKEGVQHDDEEAKLAWLRQTLEWQQDVNDSKEFVEAVKMDLFSNQVFVFSPKGDVMELPAGSTPLDFAYKIHTQIGHKCVGARVNGKMVPIDYKLNNGEIIDIVTNQNSKGPSMDWLKIVKTSAAKTKIRQFIKKQERPETAEKGKEVIERAAKRKGYNSEEILINKYLERAYKDAGFGNMAEMLTAASYGGSVCNRVINLCVQYYKEDVQAEALRKEKAAAKKLQNYSKSANKNSKGVTVKGVGNLMIHFAGCCNPVPGDEIIGFITKGKGVSVHRKDCLNMISLPEIEKARIIEVEWETQGDSLSFDAAITVVAEDRKGIFAAISKTCEDNDINITSMVAKKDREGIAMMDLVLSISNTSDITKIISKFKQVQGVTDVYRTNA